MLQGIKAVIFDFDGTLVDSMWMWKAIDIEYLSKHGIELPEYLQRDIEGMSFSETAVYFKKRFQLTESIEEIKQAWNDMAYEMYQKRVPLKPGAGEFLRFLKAHGIQTGIATSNSKELLNAAMESLSLHPLFDAVHTSCEVDKGKPSPDIYLYVAKRLSIPPCQCLVFEDILKGIQAGKAANMKVCAVEDEYSRDQEPQKRLLADYCIKDYSEIDWSTKL